MRSWRIKAANVSCLIVLTRRWWRFPTPVAVVVMILEVWWWWFTTVVAGLFLAKMAAAAAESVAIYGTIVRHDVFDRTHATLS